MKKRINLLIATIALAAVLTGCGENSNVSEPSQNADATTQSEAEMNAADDSQSESDAAASEKTSFGSFTSVTHEGEDVTEEIFSEKALTMVNVWGTFCSPCIQEMPFLGELSDEYAEKDFQIVGIVSDVTESGNELVQLIMDVTGADYTHIVLSEDLLQGALADVSAVPTTFFVDKDGNILGDAVMGARDKDSWISIIDEKLAEVTNE